MGRQGKERDGGGRKGTERGVERKRERRRAIRSDATVHISNAEQYKNFHYFKPLKQKL